MAKQRVKFTFPQELITLPIIYELGKQFNIVTNVRRADVTEDRGWVVLEDHHGETGKRQPHREHE